MYNFSGESISYWNRSTILPHHGALRTAHETDVCVVGAGIAGLTSAYLLLQAGQQVTVLEQGQIAGGDTGRTTAHLSCILDDGLAEIEKWHGREGLVKAVRSHAEAIDLIEMIINVEKIDCDFQRVDGFLFAANAEDQKVLDDEYDAAQNARRKVEWVSAAPIPGEDTGRALRFPELAKFHVNKYLSGLAQAITKLGGKIYEQTHVDEIQQGQPATVKTAAGISIKAKYVIEAANSLVSGRASTITKLFPYRTFAIAAPIPKADYVEGLFWDTEDPYHYVRTQPFAEDKNSKFELLIVGGEDHKTGQADDADERYQRLEEWARAKWPQMGEVQYRWSGQVLETPDGLALIGQNPGNDKNSFLITGDSGHGMTHGTLGARIVADLILGLTNPYAELYEPSRFHAKSVDTWVQENANVAAQYVDWISKDEFANLEDLPPDSGAIFTRGVTKLAIYKDEEGTPHACSAVCTHLYGIVSWNSEEKSWDCPCHGSRFDRFGKVLATPATEDLKKQTLL